MLLTPCVSSLFSRPFSLRWLPPRGPCLNNCEEMNLNACAGPATGLRRQSAFLIPESASSKKTLAGPAALLGSARAAYVLMVPASLRRISLNGLAQPIPIVQEWTPSPLGFVKTTCFS